MILDSISDILINPDSDPDNCWIAAKMLWIYYLVGVSHFAACRENQPVTVRKIIINKSPKVPHSARVRKVEK